MLTFPIILLIRPGRKSLKIPSRLSVSILELDHFFLDTQFIGQGFGRQLWNHCIRQAQQKGWADFTFWSDPHSLGFYEHMGAIKIDERPMVTLPGATAPIMRFFLK
jgi:GNAT superfamily N-acetyltransferase